ncbi:uncharacterized protein V6R79_002341 [Siganus canaliculatus]
MFGHYYLSPDMFLHHPHFVKLSMLDHVPACEFGFALQLTLCQLMCFPLSGTHEQMDSTCSLECAGGLDGQKLSQCQEYLLKNKNHISLLHQEQKQDADDNKDTASAEHELLKKYGGFIKRYGGFMSHRSSYPVRALEDSEIHSQEDNIRLEILKILNAVADHGGEASDQGDEAVKRYGGFMRRAVEGVVQTDLITAVLDRGLKKRYGGFMRRVGRPEWLLDSSKTEGALKRAWENSSELQKRYGGFMD